VILEGTGAPDHAAATAMPSFGAAYTDAEIAAVANYAMPIWRQAGAGHGKGRRGRPVMSMSGIARSNVTGLTHETGFEQSAIALSQICLLPIRRN